MTVRLPKVFVDLQITGDALDPSEVSAILPVTPRNAYRKGEQYYAGQRTGYLTGRTGVWYITSDQFVSSPYLDDHAAFLWSLIWPAAGDNQRLMHLRDLLVRDQLRVTISIFWAGKVPPQVPKIIDDLAKQLGANVETDFVVDDEAA
jgi:hypothetical protein